MSQEQPHACRPSVSRREEATRPDAWTFFRQWLRNPRAMAALSPSSRQLAKLMIDQLPARSERIVELGGGTGVFTQALLDSGIEPANLLVVELNEELHRLLRQRFPAVRVIRGDAQELKSIVVDDGFAQDACIDAVVSGLGMLSMSRATQRAILSGVFAVLGGRGRFIQFTYGPASPLSRELLGELGLQVRRAGVAWLNVPPATVYVYTRAA
ncbi:MAG TPA: methyltransferase domain-containing protein [Rhodanobacteraceae bacterium]|jgi:phospholipid N-methyltransferase|nr:methyltransferase domain-containing protein [Rhodanobacteraceae bacterium]